MQALLILLELMVAVGLIITVLLQRSEGGALGMGGGGGSGLGGLFSPRGAADTLTRTTTILAGLFFLACIGLNLLALHGRDEKAFIDAPASKTELLPSQKPLRSGGSVPTPH